MVEHSDLWFLYTEHSLTSTDVDTEKRKVNEAGIFRFSSIAWQWGRTKCEYIKIYLLLVLRLVSKDPQVLGQIFQRIRGESVWCYKPAVTRGVIFQQQPHCSRRNNKNTDTLHCTKRAKYCWASLQGCSEEAPQKVTEVSWHQRSGEPSSGGGSHRRPSCLQGEDESLHLHLHLLLSVYERSSKCISCFVPLENLYLLIMLFKCISIYMTWALK